MIPFSEIISNATAAAKKGSSWNEAKACAWMALAGFDVQEVHVYDHFERYGVEVTDGVKDEFILREGDDGIYWEADSVSVPLGYSKDSVIGSLKVIKQAEPDRIDDLLERLMNEPAWMRV